MSDNFLQYIFSMKLVFQMNKVVNKTTLYALNRINKINGKVLSHKFMTHFIASSWFVPSFCPSKKSTKIFRPVCLLSVNKVALTKTH